MRILPSTWFVTATCFITWCAFAARPDAGEQLVAVVSIGGGLVWLSILILQGIAKWRERGMANLISCLLIVAAFPVAQFCVHMIRSAVFQYNLDRWNEAARWVMAHKRPSPSQPIHLPLQFADLAYVVLYTHDGTCGLMIDFPWSGAFPAKHTVRRYATSPRWTEVKQCHEYSRGIHEISGNWYEFYD